MCDNCFTLHKRQTWPRLLLPGPAGMFGPCLVQIQKLISLEHVKHVTCHSQVIVPCHVPLKIGWKNRLNSQGESRTSWHVYSSTKHFQHKLTDSTPVIFVFCWLCGNTVMSSTSGPRPKFDSFWKSTWKLTSRMSCALGPWDNWTPWTPLDTWHATHATHATPSCAMTLRQKSWPTCTTTTTRFACAHQLN